MKKIAMFLACVCFTITTQLNAQSADAPGLPYQVDEIAALIFDAFENPNYTNAYLLFLNKEEAFPKLKAGNKLNAEEKKQVNQFVSTQVAIIQRLQIERKRNYDRFYLNNN